MRINKETKAIADAHIAAKASKTFDNPIVSNKEELFAALRDGKTFEELLSRIEANYCSVTSLLMQHPDILNFTPHQYKAGVYKGFRILLQGK